MSHNPFLMGFLLAAMILLAIVLSGCQSRDSDYEIYAYSGSTITVEAGGATTQDRGGQQTETLKDLVDADGASVSAIPGL